MDSLVCMCMYLRKPSYIEYSTPGRYYVGTYISLEYSLDGTDGYADMLSAPQWQFILIAATEVSYGS